MNSQDCYTVKQLSGMTGYHPNWFRHNKDKIGYVRFGRKILFPKSKVERFFSDHSNQNIRQS